MKRLCCGIVFAALLFCPLQVTARAASHLIPGGQVIGIRLQNRSVTVAAFDDALGRHAEQAGIRIGDEILSANGRMLSCPEDLKNTVTASDGPVRLTVRRKGQERSLQILPCPTPEGPRLGICLKQGISGIGTVTWYDPETGAFGALGHGVNDPGGILAPMTAGNAYPAGVNSVKPGRMGDPGQLKGTADPDTVWGTLRKNTPQGIFGTASGCPGQALPVGSAEGVRTGPAVIRSTVSGTSVQEYSVEILKIYPEDRSTGRNFLLKVTDPALLSATGGIVQGMSGSPIIQDGKLVGAVTHVLVNDPTRGYGIFIENMLAAAA